MTALLVLASPLTVSTVSAVEITPIDEIEPDNLQNDLQDLGAANELTQSQTAAQTDLKQKSKPSIWSWLTNQSRKPASYHFIDIIEILE